VRNLIKKAGYIPHNMNNTKPDLRLNITISFLNKEKSIAL
jgi:hypothetical protein